jgi:hypothetical protein
MTQTMYSHVNKLKKVKEKKILLHSWTLNMNEATAVNKLLNQFHILLCDHHFFVKKFSGMTVEL